MPQKEIVRFGVSLPNSLLKELDSFIDETGFANRSEAIRAAIRLLINKHKTFEKEEANIGVISLIYDHEKHGCQEEITEKQHLFHDIVMSSTHIHLEEDCLETIICLGEGRKIKKLFKELETVKGVKLADSILFFH